MRLSARLHTLPTVLLIWLSVGTIELFGAAPTPIPYRLGYITKDVPANAQTIAGWLGRPLDVVGTTITISGWFVKTFASNVSLAGVCVPMTSMAGWDSLNATDMGKAARGDYDGYYKNVATSLKSAPCPILSVRFGWEMNGNWYPWSAGGAGATNNTHQNYIDTFRRMATIFREIIPGVQIEFCTAYAWNPTYSNASGTPLDYWPGSQYVDVISMDFYESNIGNWATIQSKGTYNLDWLVNFSKSQGVKVGLSEWGASGDDGSFITSAAAWMNSLGSLFAYQVYSEYDPADQVVTLGTNPKEQAAWIAAWGNTYYSNATPTATSAGTSTGTTSGNKTTPGTTSRTSGTPGTTSSTTSGSTSGSDAITTTSGAASLTTASQLVLVLLLRWFL